MIKNVILTVTIAALVVVGVVLVGRSNTAVRQPLGALTGPDIPYSYLSVGGVQTYFFKTESLNQGSTTVCSIQSPNATTTLLAGRSGVNFKIGSTTAITVQLSNSTSPSPSGVILATSSLAANAQGYTSAATTTPVADSTVGRLAITNLTFSPSTWFVASASSTGVGTYSPTGTCIADFQVVQN